MLKIVSLKQYDYENYNTQTYNSKVIQKHFLKSDRKLCGSENTAWKNSNINNFVGVIYRYITTEKNFDSAYPQAVVT